MKKINLAGWILIGLVARAATGFLVALGIEIVKPIGTLFLRLLKMTIYPLIFFSIAGGIAGIADLQRLRIVGTTFVGYWTEASVLAAFVGLMFAKLIKPDQGITLPTLQTLEVNVNLLDSLINWVPNNVAQAFAEGNILQTIVFSLFLGVSISLMGNSKPGQMIADFMQAGADVMSTMAKNQPRGCRSQCR